MNIPIKSLREEAKDAATELTSTTPHPNRNCYAPHIRRIGMRLQAALDQADYQLRPDVLKFATHMSKMMDAKDKDKGVVDEKAKSEAMFKLSAYFELLRTDHKLYDPRNTMELRRVLIHIANFCMLAESNLPE